MTQEQFFRNLSAPRRPVDVILDTDTYNEIDDQFAIAYMIKHGERLNVKGICAAPFLNENSISPADGMHRSYDEIMKLLTLAKREDLKSLVHRGSEGYMQSETVPQKSDACDFMAALADSYSPDDPLYIVAIGAITNVASAIVKNPRMIENCVIVWLGGHAVHMPRGSSEFNMVQDIHAARIIFGCGVPLVQLPCNGVVSHFATSKQELEYWLRGKNELCDYLCENTIKAAESYAAGKPWTRPIWDVTAVAWLINDRGQFMNDKLIHSPIPEFDHNYAYNDTRHFIRYVYNINRDNLFEDLFRVLAK